MVFVLYSGSCLLVYRMICTHCEYAAVNSRYSGGGLGVLPLQLSFENCPGFFWVCYPVEIQITVSVTSCYMGARIIVAGL